MGNRPQLKGDKSAADGNVLGEMAGMMQLGRNGFGRMFGSRSPRTVEEKFRDFLRYGFGARLSDYGRMDKDLQAALNEKFAFVFLRNPLEEKVRQFLIAPPRRPYCHAPGCEWREGEFSAFNVSARYCVRCEHCQIRTQNAPSGWQDISRNDYEFLFEQDTAHRAQWDAPPALNGFNPYDNNSRLAFPAPVSGNGLSGKGENGDSSTVHIATARNDPSPY